MVDPICCLGQNRRSMQIAYEAGFLLGIRSDLDDYGFPIRFVDIKYKKPDFAMHLEVVKKHQPKYATVTDLSEQEVSEVDIERALKQAEMLSSYCEIVLITPKLSGQIAMLPDNIALGYSVPTRYGGIRTIPAWEFAGRRIHLLGGSPHEQMNIYRYISAIGTVMSVDGNMAHLVAWFAKYWKRGQWIKHPEHGTGKEDVPFECWQWSCQNIYQHWLSA